MQQEDWFTRQLEKQVGILEHRVSQGFIANTRLLKIINKGRDLLQFTCSGHFGFCEEGGSTSRQEWTRAGELGAREMMIRLCRCDRCEAHT